MGLFDNVIVGGLVLSTIGGLSWLAIDRLIENNKSKKAEKERQEQLAEAERQRKAQQEAEERRKSEERYWQEREEILRRAEQERRRREAYEAELLRKLRQEQAERDRRMYILEQERLRRIKLEEQRRTFPCCFSQDFSHNDFCSIVYTVSRRMRKRLDVLTINGARVQCRIYSQSGISYWDFELDFNDYGEVSGKYWWIKSCPHCESVIPESFAKQLQKEIENRIGKKG